MPVHDTNKALIAPLRAAFRSCDPRLVRQAVFDTFAPDAAIRLQYPFQDVQGPEDLWTRVYAPLFAAMPDLERRDFIVMAGPRLGTDTPSDWVGLGGNFVGTFAAPWLGIPPTNAPVYMRYHEYLRIEDGKIVEMEGLWDIAQVMHQAHAWPMPDPSSGPGHIHSTPFWGGI
ncbi:MAG: ester cyclase, partial [Pseudomonadota bacterium]